MGIFSSIIKGITGLLGDIVGFLIGVDFDDFDDQAQGALVNKQSNIDPIPVVYGSRKVGGVRVFVSTGGGKKNEYLYMAIALCEGEIQAIDQIYVNDKLHTHSDYSGLISVTKKLGTDGQQYASLLAGADDNWGANHRLRGVAYLAIRIKYDQDVFGGIPEIQCVIRGRKVYDPRTSTTAYSNNPALCLRDYLTNTRYGKGLPTSAIDDTKFIAAANEYDGTVTSYTGGPSITRVDCNARLDTGKTVFDNVKEMLQGMRGLLPYTDGKYGLIVDKEETSTFDLTPDNILSDITVTDAGKGKRFNRVIAKFPNPQANWQMDSVTYPVKSTDPNSDFLTFLSEDNDEELVREINLNTITSLYQAREMARIVCEASRRNTRSVTLTATSEAMDIAVGDVVRLEQPSLGWTGAARQLMRVVSTRIKDSGEVDLQLIEYNNVYTWFEGDEELDNQDTTLPNPFDVTAPTLPIASEDSALGPDGSVRTAVTLNWTEAADAFVNEYEVQWALTSASTYSNFVRTTETSVDLFGLNVGSEYTFRIRSINTLGVRSDFVTQTRTLVGDTTAPGAVILGGITGGIRAITATWTNPADLDYAFTEVHVKDTNTVPSVGDSPTRKIAGEEYIHPVGAGEITKYFFLRAVDFSGNKGSFTGTTNNSGTSVTATQSDLGDDSVGSNQIADGAVTTAQIASGAVTITEIETSVADLINGAAQAVDVLNVQIESGDVLDLETGQDVLIQNLGDVAIFVNESNQTINNSINTTNTTLANLEATVVDLTSGSSDIFVQPSAPVAGVGGVPDPIPTFSRWYDSDDSNEPYYWDGSAWQSLADPRIASNASAITTLQSGLNTANSNISANSSAISVLDTTTVSQGNSITTLSSDVTTLQSSLTTTQSGLSTAQTDITTNATAISGLDTRVSSAEGSITSITSDITQLQSDLTSAEGDISTNSTALSGLTTRVTTAEGTISSNTTDITALESTVNNVSTGVVATSNALGALTTRVTTAENSIVTNATDITSLEVTVNDATSGVLANASAVSSLDTRLTSAEGSITSQSSSITALESTVNDGTTGVSANASAISTLDTRITSAENDITSLSASNITALEVAVEDLTKIQGETDDVITTEAGNDLLLNLPTDVASATSAATNTLDSRITSAEDTLTSQSTDITELQSGLTTLDGEVTTNAGAITSLTTRVTTAEGSITSQASDITILQSDLTTAQGDITTNASAITGLTTRVTSAEGTITSLSSDVTTLQSDLTTAEGNITTNATGLTSLTTRVTTAEGTITSNSSDITSLQSSLTTTDGNVSTNATAITGLDTRLTSAEGTITSQSSDITTLQSDITTAEGDISTNATAITGLTTRVTTAEGNITSNSSDITSLQSDVTTAEGNITSNASAISALDTRVTSAEGTITSQASDITTLQSDLTTAEGNISSNATAVSSLTTRVTTAEGNITSNASSITALTSTVNDPTTGLAATAAVASGASTTAAANSTSITDLEAEAYLTVSAGGNVSGFKATADASGSSFTIQADRFALVSTDESQTTTPFAVDTTTGTVSFNANVEVDGDLIATGSISGGAIGNGQVGTITVASNAITLSQNQRFTNTTAANSSTYVTHFTSSYFNIDDYTDPVFVRFTSFLYPRASGGGLMVSAYAQANIRTQLLCYNSLNTLVQTLAVTDLNIYSGGATTNGLTFLRRFTITNSSVVKVKARMQFNKAGGTSDTTALFSGDVEFNVLKR